MNKSSWKYKRQGNVEALGENYVTVRHESNGIKAGTPCYVRVARYTQMYVCAVCLCRAHYVVRLQYNNTKCTLARYNYIQL